MSLSHLLRQHNLDGFRLDRSSLAGQSTALLRQQIISGRIPPGTKLVERELADLLGISRMPARDALMELEREGLVVSRSNGRYVIDLKREDVVHLFQVRVALECLAVEQAAAHTCLESCAALQANLARMADAIARGDRDSYVSSDLEAHQLIWQQACNPYLLKMLNSITGPIFMFISFHTGFQPNWQETLHMHEELSAAICAGDGAAAVRSIQMQLQNSLQLSFRVFEEQTPA